MAVSYFDHPGVGYVFLFFEQRANVECLASPEVSVHRPAEGELQGAAVEGADGVSAEKPLIVIEIGIADQTADLEAILRWKDG